MGTVHQCDRQTDGQKDRFMMTETALSVDRAVFTVRRYALHGLSHRNSVCLSVTLVDCVHMVRPKIMISSPYGRSVAPSF